MHHEKYVTLSQEQLWDRGFQGDELAVVELYDRVKGMWRNSTPKDFSGVNMQADWMQIAAEEFFEKWKRFNPDRGIKFNTWILHVIQNRWKNELVYQSRLKRVGNQHQVSTEFDYEEFAGMILEGFRSYNDADLSGVFCWKFSEWLKHKGRAEHQSVWRVLEWSGNSSPKFISGVMRIPLRKTVKLIEEVKHLAFEYLLIEKEVSWRASSQLSG